MTVFNKSTIDSHLEELDRYYKALLKTLEGKPADRHDYQVRNINPDEPKAPTLVYVNVNDALDAVGHFRVAIDNLRRLKSKEVKAR